MKKEPSNNMKAVLVFTQHAMLREIIEPALNIEKDAINWKLFNYHGQSGGVQTVLSWIYCLFCDSLPPSDWGYRDPFDGMFSLDRDIQVLILQALGARHDFLRVIVGDRPKSDFQTIIESMAKQAFEDHDKQPKLDVTVKDDDETD